MHIKKLAELSHKNAKDKGFWDSDRNTGELLMLIVSELGEALEADRSNNTVPSKMKIPMSEGIINFCMNNKNYNKEGWKSMYELELKNCFETEIADSIIRILDLCEGRGIDIEKFIEMKRHYNKSRERLHGKKY